jgi:hypothetical protein
VSFQFTVRDGCQVQVTSSAAETIDVIVTLEAGKYSPPQLPTRRDCVYSRDELDKLSPGIGTDILAIDFLAPLVATYLHYYIPFLAAYVQLILQRGIKLDAYDRLSEVNVLDASHAVLNAPLNAIPAAQGIVLDNKQPYPVYGWLDAKWVPA